MMCLNSLLEKRKNIRMKILVMIFILPVFVNRLLAGAYYVNSACGSDTYNGLAPTVETINKPWATLTKALESDIEDGSTIYIVGGMYIEPKSSINITMANKTTGITIQPYQDGEVTICLDGTNGQGLYFNGDGSNFTFKNIKFIGGGTGHISYIRAVPDKNFNVFFENCVFAPSTVRSYFVFYSSYNGVCTRELVFNNCQITAATSSFGFYLNDIKKLAITDCSVFNVVSGNHVIFPNTATDFNHIIIENSNLTVPNKSFLFLNVCNPIDTIRIANNIVSGSAVFMAINTTPVANGLIVNNTITSSFTGTMIDLGASPDDTAISDDTKSARFRVIGNRLFKRSPAVATSHAIHIGNNSRGAYIANNYIYNNVVNEFGGGIVSKGKYSFIENNVVVAKTPLYLCGGQYCSIVHNTFISNIAGGACLKVSNSPLSTPRNPLYNNIENNIFYASMGDHAVNLDDSDGDVFYDNHFDWNCYYGGTKSIFRLNARDYNDIVLLRAAWSKLTNIYGDNDANSIMAAPDFMDAENLDFRLAWTSPCLSRGRPSVGGSGNSLNGGGVIGAWQPFATQGDINNDGIVNFEDMGILANQWLLIN